MKEHHNASSEGPEMLGRALLQVLAELPEDRATPLDCFVAESLLERKAVTREQLLESIDDCRASQDPVSLFRILRSHGHVTESDANSLIELYKNHSVSARAGEVLSELDFGEIAVREKSATGEQLWLAIEEQEKLRAGGAEKSLAEILFSHGSLTASDAREIIILQGDRVLECSDCGNQFKVKDYDPAQEYICLSCGSDLSDTEGIKTLEIVGVVTHGTIDFEQADSRFVGREIGGCRVISRIGEGGMGAVYKAHHLKLNRTVAIKVMAPGLFGETHRKRFLREARAAAQLDHPNIMVVYDVGEFEDSPYIVIQYLDGKTVADILEARGKFSEVEALRIVLATAQALEAAHQHNIIHRDIKPDNIMVTEAGQVKVTDFGLAKRTSSERDMGVTSTGAILGTPLYMSPEQFSAETLDGRSDIYSLGVTFYQMVAGCPPFTGKTPYELRDKHMAERPRSPKAYSPGLSPYICKIIDRMLAKDKNQRYISSAELVKDLKLTRSRLTATRRITGRLTGRRILIYSLLALMGVAAAVILAFLLQRAGQGERGDPETENRAAKRYAQLAPELEMHIRNNRYMSALSLLGTFPAEFAGTKTRGRVEKERIRIMGLTVAFFEKAIGEINSEIARQEFAAALERSRTLAEQARGLKELISTLPQEDATAGLVEQIGLKADAVQITNREIREFENLRRQFGSRDEESSRDAARSLLKSLDPKNPELRRQLEDFRSRIPERTAAEADETDGARWHADRKRIRELLEAGSFDEAAGIMTAKAYETSPDPGIADEAAALEKEISRRRHEHIDADLQAASRFSDAWELARASEILSRYGEEGQFRERVEILMARVRIRERFLRDSAAAAGLIESGRGAEARAKLSPWLGSADKEIRQRAGKLHLEAARVLLSGSAYFESGEYMLRNSIHVDIKAFYIDKNEVTNRQYADFLKATKRRHAPGWDPKSSPDFPVTGVSYDDALAYAKWAGKRLPTVREWEIAASWDPIERKNLKYPWGNELKPDRANLGGTGPEPVGSRPGDISPGGLHDMAGNISEWSSTRDGKKIVVCGGSWADVPEAARCDTQFPYDTGTRSTRLGFRCVKDAQ